MTNLKKHKIILFLIFLVIIYYSFHINNCFIKIPPVSLHLLSPTGPNPNDLDLFNFSPLPLEEKIGDSPLSTTSGGSPVDPWSNYFGLSKEEIMIIKALNLVIVVLPPEKSTLVAYGIGFYLIAKIALIYFF